MEWNGMEWNGMEWNGIASGSVATTINAYHQEADPYETLRHE
jgi:hypothetical protein